MPLPVMGSTSWPFNAEGPVLSKMLDGVCHGIMVYSHLVSTLPPKKTQGASYVVIPFVLPLRWNHPILCAPSRNTQAQNAADFACAQASTGAQNAVDVIGIVFSSVSSGFTWCSYVFGIVFIICSRLEDVCVYGLF